jgi:Sortase domain
LRICRLAYPFDEHPNRRHMPSGALGPISVAIWLNLRRESGLISIATRQTSDISPVCRMTMTGGAGEASAPPVETTSAAPGLTPHSNLSTYRSTRTHSETALPVRLRIPAIDVDTRLDSLGLVDDKSIEVPGELGVAGWWEGGPRPGQVGPAVIMGHVRWNTGPAVFSRLRSLQRGDELRVDRADGTTARFVVTGRHNYRRWCSLATWCTTRHWNRSSDWLLAGD